VTVGNKDFLWLRCLRAWAAGLAMVAALGLGSCPLWVCLSSVAVALCGGFCGACGRFAGYGGILGRGGGVAAVWAFYIVLVMGGRWWSSVVVLRGDGLRGCALAAGAVQLRGDCDGVVRRFLRWVGPYVAGCFMAALGAFSRALGLGVGLWVLRRWGLLRGFSGV